MNQVRNFMAALFLFMAAFQAKADVAENGGVIILRADYSFFSHKTAQATLVVVTSEMEVRSMCYQIQTETDTRYVHVLLSPGYDLWIQSVSPDYASGYIVGSKQAVVVVSREYASYYL